MTTMAVYRSMRRIHSHSIGGEGWACRPHKKGKGGIFFFILEARCWQAGGFRTKFH